MEVTGSSDFDQTRGRNSPEEMFPLVYEELRRLATAKMALQPATQTLQATALVHEAWLKLRSAEPSGWTSRSHFFRAAAEAMRHILIDRARARHRLKRGANQVRISLDDVDLAAATEPDTVLLVDEAIEGLAKAHPDQAELVKLRFYAGLSIDESARALGVSEKTAKRRWTHARAWLFREISRTTNT